MNEIEEHKNGVIYNFSEWDSFSVDVDFSPFNDELGIEMGELHHAIDMSLTRTQVTHLRDLLTKALDI